MGGSFYYPAYGLQLCSSRSIPSLVPIEKNGFPCVGVSFEGLPRWFGGALLKECRTTLIRQLPYLTVTVIQTPTDTYWHLWYTDHRASEYLIKNDGLEIWVSWRESVAFADVCASLLGPVVFGLVLQLRGRTSLHASTVVIDGLAVAFLGPSEAGKSTTAAKFAQLGYAVLAEDVLSFLPDDNEFMATPGYPVIDPRPQSVEMLHSRADTSSYQPAGRGKLVDLQPGAYRFETEPRPLAAIYVLKTRKDDGTAPYLEPLEQHRALLELVPNTLGQFDAECRVRNFSFLARLARAVPLRKMVPHSNPDRLEKMCELIAGDFRKQVVPWWKMRTGTHV